MINVHYAIQTCDSAYNSCENDKRYCSNNRTTVSKKCLKSFFESVKYVTKIKSDVKHTVKIFDDHSSQDLLTFLIELKREYTSTNIEIEIESLSNSGIMYSIGKCYNWLKDNGKDLVYQIQDDYLFNEDAIYQMIDIFMQVYSDTNQPSIIAGYQDPFNWYSYRYKSTPRMVVPGKSQNWIQCYDLTCTFLTAHSVFIQHWDMLEYFLSLDPMGGETGKKLENISLNRIVVDRNVLGLMPFSSVCLHMQSDYEKDPYIDWVALWDRYDVNKNLGIWDKNGEIKKETVYNKEPKINLPDKVLLNIGSGKSKLNFKSLSEFKEISFDADEELNPDIVGDMLHLDVFDSNSIDVIWASHVLEHIHTLEVPDVLRQVNRILKLNGVGIFVVPDLQSIGDKLSLGDIHKPLYTVNDFSVTPMDMIYSHILMSKDKPYMMHKTGFTEKYAIELLGSLNINGYTKSMGHNLFILIAKYPIENLCVDVDEVLREFFY